jgi:hypothetical protein
VRVDSLFTEREALDRLDVAGATLLTAEEVLFCCDTLRVDELLLPATLRLDELLLPTTLRLDEVLLPATLRLDELLDTLRLLDEELVTDLDATPDAVETVRLALEADTLRLAVLRLRFLSHPPLLILRLGVKVSTLLCTT